MGFVTKQLDAVEIESESDLDITTDTQIRINTPQLLINYVPLEQYVRNIVFDENITTVHDRTTANIRSTPSSEVDLSDAFNSQSSYSGDEVTCLGISAKESHVHNRAHCVTLTARDTLRLDNQSSPLDITHNVNTLEDFVYSIVNQGTANARTPTQRSFTSDPLMTLSRQSTRRVADLGTFHTNKLYTSQVNIIDAVVSLDKDGKAQRPPTIIESDSAVNLNISTYVPTTNASINRAVGERILFGNSVNLKKYIYEQLNESGFFDFFTTVRNGVDITMEYTDTDNRGGFHNREYGNHFRYRIRFDMYDEDGFESERIDYINPTTIKTENEAREGVYNDVPIVFDGLTAGHFYRIYANVTNLHTNTTVQNIGPLHTNVATIPHIDVSSNNITFTFENDHEMIIQFNNHNVTIPGFPRIHFQIELVSPIVLDDGSVLYLDDATGTNPTQNTEDGQSQTTFRIPFRNLPFDYLNTNDAEAVTIVPYTRTDPDDNIINIETLNHSNCFRYINTSKTHSFRIKSYHDDGVSNFEMESSEFGVYYMNTYETLSETMQALSVQTTNEPDVSYTLGQANHEYTFTVDIQDTFETDKYTYLQYELQYRSTAAGLYTTITTSDYYHNTASNASLVYSNANTIAAGNYSIIVRNVFGTVSSNSTALNITDYTINTPSYTKNNTPSVTILWGYSNQEYSITSWSIRNDADISVISSDQTTSESTSTSTYLNGEHQITLTQGTSYSFTVRAVDSLGRVQNSDSTTIVINSISNFRHVSTSVGANRIITVEFKANSNSSFNVEYGWASPHVTSNVETQPNESMLNITDTSVQQFTFTANNFTADGTTSKSYIAAVPITDYMTFSNTISLTISLSVGGNITDFPSVRIVWDGVANSRSFKLKMHSFASGATEANYSINSRDWDLTGITLNDGTTTSTAATITVGSSTLTLPSDAALSVESSVLNSANGFSFPRNVNSFNLFGSTLNNTGGATLSHSGLITSVSTTNGTQIPNTLVYGNTAVTNTTTFVSAAWVNHANNTISGAGSTTTLSNNYLIVHSTDDALVKCTITVRNVVGFSKVLSQQTTMVKGTLSNQGFGTDDGSNGLTSFTTSNTAAFTGVSYSVNINEGSAGNRDSTSLSSSKYYFEINGYSGRDGGGSSTLIFEGPAFASGASVTPIDGTSLSNYQSFKLSARLIDTNGFLRNAITRFSSVANIAIPDNTEQLSSVASPTSSQIGTTYFSVNTNNNNISDGQSPTSSTYYLRISGSSSVDAATSTLNGSPYVTITLASSDLNSVKTINSNYIASGTWTGSPFTLTQATTYYCQIYRSFSGGWSTHYTTNNVANSLAVATLTPPTTQNPTLTISSGFLNLMHEWYLNTTGKVDNPAGVSTTPVSSYKLIIYFKYATYDSNFYNTVTAASTFNDITYSKSGNRISFTDASMQSVMNDETDSLFEQSTTEISTITISQEDLEDTNHRIEIKFSGATNLIPYSEVSGLQLSATEKTNIRSPDYNYENKSFLSNGSDLYWHYILEYKFTQYGYPSIFSSPFIRKAGAAIHKPLSFRKTVSNVTLASSGNTLRFSTSGTLTGIGNASGSYHKNSWWVLRYKHDRGSVVPTRDIESARLVITLNTSRLTPTAISVNNDTREPSNSNPAWVSVNDKLYFSNNIYNTNDTSSITFTSTDFNSLGPSNTFYMFFILILKQSTYTDNNQITANTIPKYSANNWVIASAADLFTSSRHVNAGEYFTVSATVTLTNPTVTLNSAHVIITTTSLAFSIGTSATDAIQYTDNGANNASWTSITISTSTQTLTKTKAEVTALSNTCTLIGLTANTAYTVSVGLTYSGGFTNPSASFPSITTLGVPPTITLHGYAVGVFRVTLEFTVGTTTSHAVQYTNNDASNWTQIRFYSDQSSTPNFDETFTWTQVDQLPGNKCIINVSSNTAYAVTVELTYPDRTISASFPSITTLRIPPTVTLNDLSGSSGTRDSITISSSDYTVTNNDYTPRAYSVYIWTTVDGGRTLGNSWFSTKHDITFGRPWLTLTPFTTYYFSVLVYFTGLDSPVSHPASGSYKPRSTSGTAPTIMFTNNILTSRTDINPTTDFTITNGDAGNWSEMVIKLVKFKSFNNNYEFYSEVEAHTISYSERADTVSFSNDIFAPLIWGPYHNYLRVSLEYTNSLIPVTDRLRYVTWEGELYPDPFGD